MLGLLAAEDSRPCIDFYVNTSRFVLWELEQSGKARALQDRGITLVTDTCTYVTPVMGQASGLIMTNSGKWAHYAPANIGVAVAFGSLRECVLSAIRGEVVLRCPLVTTDGPGLPRPSWPGGGQARRCCWPSR